MILEGWRDTNWSGRYIAVRHDCASPSVAHWIARLAKKVGVTDSAFMATAQTTAKQIAALSPAASDGDPAFDETKSSAESAAAPDEEAQVAPARAPAPPEPVQLTPPEAATAPEPETAEAAAERERRYREIFGIDEQEPPADGSADAELLDAFWMRPDTAGLRTSSPTSPFGWIRSSISASP
jgi:hypothetical protein